MANKKMTEADIDAALSRIGFESNVQFNEAMREKYAIELLNEAIAELRRGELSLARISIAGAERMLSLAAPQSNL